ncbi:PREDICTED: putative FBD-associated F-box protein At1g78730 [Camelina sativa]|uniref:FBD-associated F-box protein At1g78730 n=1 Tax=Camelina sativa TaxID=90675 RepID=A0ABM0TQE9_CAMSA|nr:PREDICTED: putative FBD-associated F-box protein At1g78730 [Camelina sativa]
MDEDAESSTTGTCVRAAKRSGNLDRLSKLPDCLLCQILLKLPTKDVVKTGVLSSRWGNLWRYVPGLDLRYGDFPEYKAFMCFVDRFLGFNSESCLQNFKLNYQYVRVKYEWKWDDLDNANVARWINTVVNRKVEHLHILDGKWCEYEVQIPPAVYTCDSLVSLKLSDVSFTTPKSVSLPSLKVMYLDMVKFANDWSFEMLISGCPVLESLTIKRSACDNVDYLRVCSQSLLSFTLMGHCNEDIDEEQVVAIDAPKLENLKLYCHETASFVINNSASLVKTTIDVLFNLSFEKGRFDPNDLPKRNMIRNFLLGISSVKEMDISSDTLEVIYNYSRCERLPLFRNLSSLHVDFGDYRWEMLPVFLESCPNLKSLSLGFSKTPGEEPISILLGPHCNLPSLEFVDIVKPMVEEEATEMKLMSYFLENSPILKKLTLRLGNFRGKENESAFLRKLLTVPRLSSSCQVVIC